jgi:hypothetical protein
MIKKIMLNIKSKALKFFAGLMVAAFVLTAVQSASAATVSFSSTVVKKGALKADVMTLQSSLNAILGANLAAPLVVDGLYGAKTTAAIKQFQAWVNTQGGTTLTVDGIAGPLTLGKIVAVMAGTSNGGTNPCPAGAMYNPQTGALCSGSQPSQPQSGPVAVSLATDNPGAGSSVVTGQATADLAHFTFTGTGTITSIQLQRTGVSTSSTLQSVYLYQGATRLTDSATVNTNGIITFNGLNLMVNGSTTVSVKADIQSGSTASGQTVGVALTGYMVSGATAMTAANVSGNVMTVSNGNGILAGVSMTGTTTPSSTQSVNAGVSNYVLWSTPVQVNTRAVLLKGATFHFIGSAPMDSLQNIKLYVNGLPVSTASGVNSLGYIVFDLSATPLTLNTGSSTVDVRADIVKGSARSFNLTLQNAADFMTTDSQLGVNVAVCTSGCGGATPSFSQVAASNISVNAGSVSVSIDPTFQNMTNVTGGATNTTIGKFKLTAYGEDVKVQTISITPNVASGVAAGSSDLNSLNNVSLYFNGSQVGSSTNWTSGAIVFQLGSSMIIPAGKDSSLEVRADVQTSDNYNFTSGTVTVALNTGVNNGQGMSSLDSSIDVPPATVTTAGLTIATGTLAVAANPAYTAQTVSPNQAGVKIGSFVLQNQSSSESVRVTNLAVSIALGAGAGSTNYSNLRTSETSGSGATPINPATAAASGTSLNNFSVDFTLAPGATKTVDVFADVGAAAGTTVTATVSLTPTALGVSSNVNVTPSAATGQLITVATGTFGNAGVIVSSSTQPQYIAAGSTGAVDATKATFNFKATSGTATISELKFLVSTTSSHASVSSVRVGTVTAPVVNGVAYLTGLNISVPNGGAGVNVDAFMTYGPVGTNGNTSGDESFVEMTYIKYSIGGSTTTTVGGQSTLTDNSVLGVTSTTPAAAGSTGTITLATAGDSNKFQPGMLVVIDRATTDALVQVQSVSTGSFVGYTITAGSGAVSSSNIYFYSIPQVAAYSSAANNCPALSDAGVTAAATTYMDCMSIVGSKPTLGVVDASSQLVNGLVKVGSVTVAADSHGDIALNTLPLNFTSTGNVSIASGTNNVVVKNAADQSTVTTTNDTLAVTAGSSDNTTVTFTGGYTVTAGSTVTLDVYVTAATVTNGPGANALSMALYTASGLTWTDVAGSGATGAESGTLLYNYPTNSSVIND